MVAPRDLAQSAGEKVELDSGQASGMGTHVSWPVVEGSTRNVWGGVPMRRANVLQEPSLPSQNWDGEKENGLAVISLCV